MQRFSKSITYYNFLIKFKMIITNKQLVDLDRLEKNLADTLEDIHNFL